MKKHYLSPFGWIEYVYEHEMLEKMKFCEKPDDINVNKDVIYDQLNAYFAKEIKTFHSRVEFKEGTDFQKRVWNALLNIPYGETRTYKEISFLIGSPKAVRAVGQACKKNPISIMVPCHRVIGTNGSMTGYSGKNHIDLKVKLLTLEGHIK